MTTTRDLPTLPAIIEGTVAHRRRGPVAHDFRHRAYQWLVDLDQLPRLPWALRPLAGFSARDHLGGTGPDAGEDIKTNVQRFVAHHGADLDVDGRVVMLANARVLGHVFDPLTVFWCFGADGSLRCVVAEVHNTYGERHAYLLRPDADGEAIVDKQLYVSPFNDVSGHYVLRFDLTSRRVRVTVSLVRAGRSMFSAKFEGTPSPAVPWAVARAALRTPAMPQRVSALIRIHGSWLWLRRLPIIERPIHRPQKGV